MSGPQKNLLLASILKIAQSFRALSARAPCTPWQIEHSKLSAQKMRALNRRYLGKDRATDVLSFPAPAALRSQGFLGELLICDSVLARQAREHGHSMKTEETILLIHGLLHLLGFDHEAGPRQARVMKDWEQKLLKKLRLDSTGGLIARSGRDRG